MKKILICIMAVILISTTIFALFRNKKYSSGMTWNMIRKEYESTDGEYLYEFYKEYNPFHNLYFHVSETGTSNIDVVNDTGNHILLHVWRYNFKKTVFGVSVDRYEKDNELHLQIHVNSSGETDNAIYSEEELNYFNSVLSTEDFERIKVLVEKACEKWKLKI